MGHSLNIKDYDRGDGIDSYNITYNLSPMYYLCLKNCGYKHITDFGASLNNKKLKDIKPMIVAMYNELVVNSKKYIKLNPDNGRGSYGGLLHILHAIIIASCEKPNGILENWY